MLSIRSLALADSRSLAGLTKVSLNAYHSYFNLPEIQTKELKSPPLHSVYNLTRIC